MAVHTYMGSELFLPKSLISTLNGCIWPCARVPYGRALDDALLHDDRLYIRPALGVSLRIMPTESCAGAQHPVAALCYPYTISVAAFPGGHLGWFDRALALGACAGLCV